jgi:2-hydroxychromene-2-carboxylate isomerase
VPPQHDAGRPAGDPIACYFDFLSPYAYLALGRARKLARAHGRELELRPVLLGVTVMQVMGLKPIPQTPLKGDYARRDVERLARLHGVPFRHHGLAEVSPVAAMRAFLHIRQQDAAAADAFATRVFDRLWQAGGDISRFEGFAADVAAVGQDPAAVQAASESPAGRALLRQAVQAAVDAGVFGVPFFIADGEPFWGGDRLPMLDHWLTHGNWDRPASPAVDATR